MTGYSKYIKCSPTQKLCFSPKSDKKHYNRSSLTYHRCFLIAISKLLKKKPLSSIPALHFGSVTLPEQKHTYDPGVFTQMFEVAHGLVSKHSSISEIMCLRNYIK